MVTKVQFSLSSKSICISDLVKGPHYIPKYNKTKYIQVLRGFAISLVTPCAPAILLVVPHLTAIVFVAAPELVSCGDPRVGL